MKNTKFKINRNIAISIVIVILVIIVLFITGIAKFDGTIRLSDLISFAGIMIAFLSFKTSTNQNKKNLKMVEEQQNQNKKDKENEQANKICCWIDGNFRAGKTIDPSKCNVTIQNDFSLPAYNVYIFSTYNRVKDDAENFTAAGDFTIFANILKPGTSHCTIRSVGSAMGGIRPAVAIMFKDVNSVFWFRGPSGNLIKFTEDEANLFLRKLKVHFPISPTILN